MTLQQYEYKKNNLEPEDNKKLEKYFNTKKSYIQLALLILGMIVVFFLFKKMKVDYTD